MAIAVGVALVGCSESGTATPASDPVSAVATPEPADANVTAGLPRLTPSGAHNDLDDADNPDWMGALPDDRPLSRISMPGTHDTMSMHGGKAGPAVVTQETFDSDCGEPVVPTCLSRHSLAQQLSAGIRALDIRVRRDETGTLALQHGAFYQEANLDDVLGVVDEFLAQHPRETVLMRVKAECTNDGTPFSCTDAGGAAPDPALIDRSLAAHPRVWAPSAAGHAPVPTLREVRGAIVVTRFPGIADDRGLTVDEQDMWDGPDREAKWAAAADHLDRAVTAPPDALFVNYLSANGAPDPTKFPGRYAAYENQQALDRLRGETGTTTGVLMMDFPGPELVDEIVRHNPA